MSEVLTGFLDEVLVILVIYRCELKNSATWSCLLEAAEHYKQPLDLFLYDNSPGPQEYQLSQYLRTRYHNNPGNPGVSKAYNEGYELARRLNKKWLLLLDQDSSFPNGWLEKYLDSIRESPQHFVKVPIQFSGDIIISPFKYWAAKGFYSRSLEPGVYSLEEYFAINSGLLIDRRVFESVEGYDELIPLDFSDFAVMWKLKTNKHSLDVIDLRVAHNLSSVAKQETVLVLARFRQYCVGSKRMIHYTHQPLRHFLLAAGRSMLLGIRHRSIKFITILIESWLTV